MSVGTVVKAVGIGAGIVGGIALASHLTSRKDVDHLTDELMRQFDHDGSGAIEYGRTPANILEDERFTRSWVEGNENRGGPATSVDGVAHYGVRLFTQHDANRDGVLSRDEARAGIAALDRNGDGKVGGLFSGEKKTHFDALEWVKPKMLDYRPPSTNIGVTDY